MARNEGGSGSVARGAGIAAGKTALLIGIAVVLGIVLLQVVDDGSDVSVETTTAVTTAPAGTEATTTPTTTTGTTTPAREPSSVRLVVLNGGAPSGTAGAQSTALEGEGYTAQETPADWSGRDQSGIAVMCKPGFEREATALATAVGNGATTEDWPSPAPPASEAVDCVVVVGT